MRTILLYMLLLCGSLPVLAAENEIKLGVTTSTRYNDNVSNVASGKQDSFAFEVGPSLVFDSKAQTYEGGLSYSPRYTYYTQEDRDDDLNHSFGAHAEYRPTERLTLRLRDVLGLQQEADRDFDSQILGDADNGGDKQTLRNNLNGNVRYGVTQRFTVSGNGGYNRVEREDKDLSDINQFSGQFQNEYAFDPKNSIGGGFQIRHQEIETSRERNETVTDYYGVFAYWSHRFTPLLGFSATGGPTWVVARRENDGRSGASKELEYFANVELLAEFEGGSTALSYQRSSSDVAFSSTSYLIDVVSFRADWAWTPKIIFGATTEWNNRKAVLRFGEGNFVDEIEQWRAAGTVSWRLTPELVAGLTVDYLRQDAEGLAATDRVRAVVTFDYNARSFRF